MGHMAINSGTRKIKKKNCQCPTRVGRAIHPMAAQANSVAEGHRLFGMRDVVEQKIGLIKPIKA